MSINSVPLEPTDPRALVVGLDYGTLSGRAVVVRVADGAELGSAVTDYPHGVVDRTLPGSDRPPAARLGAAGARGLHRGAARRRPGSAARPRASTRRTSSGSAPTSPPARWCPPRADGTPLCELAGVRRPPARLRQAVEAPRRPAAGRPDQRAGRRARRAVAAALRRADLLGVGVRQGPASSWRRTPERLRRDGPLGRGRRLDRLAAVPAPTSATPAPPATRASYQDGQLPVDGLPRRAEPGLRAASSSDKLDHPIGQLGDRAGRLTAAGRRLDRACPRASPSRSATSTRTSRPRPRRPSSPASWSPSWAPRPAT